MKKGCFISLEGGEGAGKSTIASLLKEHLEERGLSVVMTREPGGIEISEQIRSIILNPENTNMDARTEALLYAASRRQHLIERVAPALEQGKVVLCDRFIDSSLAYQGHARGLGIDEVLGINQFAIGNCMPNLTIYFDLEPEEGLSRILSDQTREINRLDMEQLHFHHKVREGYHIIMKRFSERIKAVDAGKPIGVVYNDVLGLIEKHIFKA